MEYISMKSNINNIRLLLSVIFLLMACLKVMAQTMIAKPFPFFYQLFSNEIFDIHQDKEGYVWIGTTDGLARYDGVQLHTFRNDFEHAGVLTDNSVVYMADNDQYLWVGTARGITLYNKVSWTTKPVDNKLVAGKYITDIKADSHGTVWMAIEGYVVRASADGMSFKKYIMPSRIAVGFHQLYVDRQDQVWVMSDHGLFKYNPRKDAFVKYPRLGRGDSPYTMLRDKAGYYWIGTWGEGLWLMEDKGSDKTVYLPKRVGVTGSNADDRICFSIAQDDTFGYLWTLSYNELHVLRYVDGDLVPVDISNILDPHKMFTKIVKDREGNLWLGSYDMGYNIFFDSSGISNYTFPKLKANLGWDPNILNMAYDGVVWLSQDRYGLIIYDPARDAISDVHSPLGEVNIIKPAKHLGGMWVNSRTATRILRMVREGMDVRPVEDINLEDFIANPGGVTDFEEDSYGNLWILTQRNVFIKANGKRLLTSLNGAMSVMNAISADRNGIVWGVSGKTLCRMSYQGGMLHADAVATIDSLDDGEKVNKLSSCPDGSLWALTSLGRILKTGKDAKSFTDTKLGALLIDGALLGAVADRNSLWLVSNKRVIHCSLSGAVIRSYEANADNISVKAFRMDAFCPDGRGGFFAGGHNGFVHISGENDASSTPAEVCPVVTDVTVDGADAMFTAEEEKDNRREVVIPAGSRNITISFSTLRYSPQERRVMSYKLEGVDKGWQEARDGQGTAFYNKLPKGSYHFKIRVRQKDGTWSEGYDAIIIIRKPFFYESTWAYILYVFLLLAAIWLIRRYRRPITKATNLVLALRKMYLGRLHVSFIGQSASQDDSDNTFVNKLAEYVDANLEGADFGVDQLSSLMSMSRSTLHRKVKTTTELTPQEFIHRRRMKKACELLETPGNAINDVTYATGFTNPKYFSKVFKDEFGITPSQYQKKHDKK